MRVLLLSAAMAFALVSAAYARLATNGTGLNGVTLNGVTFNLAGINGTTQAADGTLGVDLNSLQVVKATIRH